jgi:eukaryotic-like serine/threonine-protein kinase
MPLTSGTKLGPYEIVAPLGAGGMGEVYRARDTRLDRDVAVKVLSGHFVSAPSLKERFDREARTISQLSHPNICRLYDVGSQDGFDYLVMECLEGETLADRLNRGPLPLEEVLRYGAQIADALDKAHQQGVVHRDLKPGNIMLTKSGAKVLDFGLAKQAQAKTTSSSALTAMTSGKALTVEGTIVGTFQYMAPEQIEGAEADTRTDIFALGCLLYEMATGKRAFAGKTQASVIASILATEPPPLSQVAPMTPPALERLVRSCMAKEREDRIQSAHDVKLQLQWIAEAGSQAGVPAPVVARRRVSHRIAWAIAAIAAAAAIVFAIGFFLRAPVEPRPLRVSILPPDQHSFDPLSIALSPDGTKLAFVATVAGIAPQLWVRPLDSTAAQPLAGTDDASSPFWSPDSRSLGFFAQGKLRIIEASGGAVQTLADAPQSRGGTWGANGVILYTPSPTSPLLRIPAAGGTPSQVEKSATSQADSFALAASPRWPAFLPDGRHFIFFRFSRDNPGSRGDIHLGSLDSQQDTVLVSADGRGQFASGHLVFVRDGNLMTQRFDDKKLKPVGDPVPIAEQIRGNDVGAAAFSLSNDGKLIFAGGQTTSLDLAWYDRSGKKGDVIDTGTFQDSHISPDGKRVSAARADAGGHLEIYIYDLIRGTKSQFSFSQSRDDDPVWSPDGNTIVFDSGRNGKIDLYTRPANGARSEELLYHDDLNKYPSSWSSDGKYLAYETVESSHFDIWIMPMFGDRKPYPFLKEKYNTRFPVFSTDAKWIAYTSYEAGHAQVYVVAFPTPGGRFLVGDGFGPAWGRNGKEILYIDDHSRVASVEVTAHGDSVELGKPQILFPTQPVGPGLFEVSPDGNHFLMVQAPVQNSPSLTLVVNWLQEAKK